MRADPERRIHPLIADGVPVAAALLSMLSMGGVAIFTAPVLCPWLILRARRYLGFAAAGLIGVAALLGSVAAWIVGYWIGGETSATGAWLLGFAAMIAIGVLMRRRAGTMP